MKKYSKRITEPCPKCGSRSLTCSFSDNSDQHYIADWVFEFEHSCNNCGYEETRAYTIGVDYETVNDYTCPLCGENWFKAVTDKKH